MKKLINSIVEDKKKKGISNKTIAKRTNLSPGTISNYFNNVWGMPFHKFIEIISIIYSEDHEMEKKNLMIEHFLEKTDKLENIKEAMEWYLITYQTSKAHELLEKNREKNVLFNAYDLIIKRTNREIKVSDFYKQIDQLRDIGSKQKDFLSFIKIANMYSVYDLKGFDMLPFLSEETMKHINELSNDFLKESYKLRTYELNAVANLMKDNLEIVDEIALSIIDAYDEQKYPLQIVSMYSILSERHLFTDFDTAMFYNQEAFRTMRNSSFGDSKHRQAVLENTHDFIKIHHGIYEGLYLKSKPELAHYYAKIGKSEKAVTILSELESKNGTLSPFQLYYKALALKSKDMLNKAKYEFIRSGNLHYMKLVEKM